MTLNMIAMNCRFSAVGYCTQRFSYEQCGSKLAFAFRHAQSGIFWFCFSFFCQSEIPKISRPHKNTQTLACKT